MKKYTIDDLQIFDDLKIFKRDVDGYLICPTGDYSFVKNLKKCKFGYDSKFGDNCEFVDCIFGNNCEFGVFCEFKNCTFGEFCTFSEKCTVNIEGDIAKFTTFKDCIISHNAKINNSIAADCKFGDNCKFGDYCGAGDCEFGDNCKFGYGCGLYGNKYGKNVKFGKFNLVGDD